MTIAQQLERKGFEKRWQEGILLDIHAVARLFLQEGITIR